MSGCACVYTELEDIALFATDKIVTARKRHRCSECFRTIYPGDKYEYVFGRWCDGIGTYKTCADCLSMRSVLYCDGWAYTGLWDDFYRHIDETVGNIELSFLSELTPRAREKAVEMIDEYLEGES